MIKLYGLRMSNYYSLTKALLIEKGLAFEEVKAPPTQKEDNLARSPMGKMPSIEVDGRYLSESLAIFHYLERLQPEPALLPSEPFESAKVMELCLHMKLDVELVARRLLPEMLMGQPVSEETRQQVTADLERGQAAVGRLFVGAPFAAGDTFTVADLYTYYCYGLASALAQKVIGVDVLARQPEVAALLGRLAERPSIAQVTSEAGG